MKKKPIIATELLKGQGLGNQLFCYVTTRALAYAKGYDFSILNKELLDCMYFMEIDCGLNTTKEKYKEKYYEKEERIFIGNSRHDIEHGCYITGVDNRLLSLDRTTLLYGNMQDETYFGKYKKEIKEWLKVKPEYDCMDYSRENLCIINIRGGEYTSNPELFLRQKYWLDAMKMMRQIRSDMEFMTVTDDIAAAKRILPEVKAYHFDLAGDYTAIKNAHYLILSNSTFAFFQRLQVTLFNISLHRNIGQGIMSRMATGRRNRIFIQIFGILIDQENFIPRRNVRRHLTDTRKSHHTIKK